MRIQLLGCLLAASLVAQTIDSDKRIVFSTLEGGDGNDIANAVAVDGQGNLYVTGETESKNFKGQPLGGKPLTSAVFKGYVTKYAPDGKKVLWSYLIGGSSNTVPHAIALDKKGNVWIAGTTGARDFPLVNPVQATQTGLNICFLLELDPEGKLLFSTYFGGNRNEEGLAVATDSQGNVYLAGRASSADLPVKNAFQARQAGGGQDAFIAKYTADHKLAWASYLGGESGTDNIYAIAVGPDDALYVTGETMSNNLATKDAYQQKPTSYSSFAARVKANGEGVDWFTYVGWPGGYTKAHAIAVDAGGRVYVGGETSVKTLKTSENALQSNYAGGMKDGFLLRLTGDGTAAEYLTYIGGSASGPTDPDESVDAIAIDAHGHVHMTGHTNSKDFLSRRAFQGEFGGIEDAWYLRLGEDLSEVVTATFWGGGKKDNAGALALGPGEAVTLAGVTYSANFPTKDAVQTGIGSGNDAFVAQFCEPWLSANWNPTFTYTLGGELPAAAWMAIATGCRVPFAFTELSSDQAWLTAKTEALTVPMDVQAVVNPEGLAAGEYKATLRIKVPGAVQETIAIPITLVVLDPPPPPVEEMGKKKAGMAEAIPAIQKQKR